MPEDVPRESLEVDVLFVGAGPASLAAALHLSQRCEQAGVEPPSMLVIEKADDVGAHQLSGAVVKGQALDELVPDWREQGFPVQAVCSQDALYWLTRRRAIRFPVTPPQFRNHGNLVISLYEAVRWLAARAEERGIEIYPGFPAAKLLFEGDLSSDGDVERGAGGGRSERVVGVQIRDRAVDRDGKRKANFEPGPNILARCVVLGEGPRGSCTKQLLRRTPELAGPNPPSYATGVKEIWRIDPEKHRPGRVIHTMGWPLDPETFGGSWIYDLKDSRLSIGFVTGLDAENPWNDPHDNLQRFKQHPFVRDLLEGGEIVRAGAKVIPEGGLFSQPRLYGDGFLLVGDSASMCNGARLKGVHMALKSGMLAAEALLEAHRREDWSAAALGTVAERYRQSWAWREHWADRNFHAAWKWVHAMPRWLGWLRQLPFFANVGAMMVTGGRGLRSRIESAPDHTHMKPLAQLAPHQRARREKLAYDNALTFDKVTAVAYAGSHHEVDQPHHLRVSDVTPPVDQPHLSPADPSICADRCAEEFGNPCESFCPAAVYEMVPDEARPGRKRLLVHHENCVHCKTCDVADPYQAITWTTPEGGEGPDYTGM